MNKIQSFEEFSLNENDNEIVKAAKEIVKNSTEETAEADLKVLQGMAKKLKDAAKNEAWLKTMEEFVSGPGKKLEAPKK